MRLLLVLAGVTALPPHFLPYVLVVLSLALCVFAVLAPPMKVKRK